MRVTDLLLFFRKMRHLAVAVLSVALLVSVSHVAASGAIAQSYSTTSTDITPGTLLSSIDSDAKTVEPASSSKNLSRLVGVAANEPLLELSGSAKSSVQVVTSGSTQTLVSDINGPVKSGDKITASPVDGIGMKAARSSEVIGTAQGSLDKVTTAKRNVTDKDGKSMEITVGLLPVAINVSYYSVAASDSVVSSLVPPFIQSMADSVTGRRVSPMRVLIGMMALFLGFVAVIVILYVTIRHGIVSLGRNPLAENVVRKGLVDALLTALGVLVITVALVYGILLT